MKSRPGRNVVDMVVARLPSPDRLKERSGGRKSSSYDEEDDGEPSVGEVSAVEDFCKEIGVKPKDPKMAAQALRDLIAICSGGKDDEESDEDNED